MVNMEDEVQESIDQSAKLPLISLTGLFEVIMKIVKKIFRR